MFDLISIGDCAIDTYISLINTEIDIKKGQKRLCLPFGCKIPVDSSQSLVGGNAANIIVGGSRLGLKGAIYTNVGNDYDAQKILAKLKEEKVDLRYVSKNPNLPSNHNVVLDFQGDRTILVNHQLWTFNLPDLDRTRWIYLTSLAPSFINSSIINQIVSFLERTGSRLFYNPGTFQIKLGVRKNTKLLALTEVLIVNKQEAHLILGYQEVDNISIKKLLKGLAVLGPKMVVITDGGDGSYSYDGEKFFELKVFPAQVVETTGCGDAYAIGVLCGLFYGNSIREAMRWGSANSASVIEQIGPQVGLLTYEMIQKRLKDHGKIVTKEF